MRTGTYFVTKKTCLRQGNNIKFTKCQIKLIHTFVYCCVYKTFHQTVKYGHQRNHILPYILTGLEIQISMKVSKTVPKNCLKLVFNNQKPVWKKPGINIPRINMYPSWHRAALRLVSWSCSEPRRIQNCRYTCKSRYHKKCFTDKKLATNGSRLRRYSASRSWIDRTIL